LHPFDQPINLRPRISSAMFLKYNTQLGPPFHVIIDTNFVNFSIKNRIDVMKGLMDCLYAKGSFVLKTNLGSILAILLHQ
jgi:U3 small nucleolar RNA-associated protein 24